MNKSKHAAREKADDGSHENKPRKKMRMENDGTWVDVFVDGSSLWRVLDFPDKSLFLQGVCHGRCP